MESSFTGLQKTTATDYIPAADLEKKSVTTKQNKTIYSISRLTNFIPESVTNLVTACISITARAVSFISSSITWVMINRGGLALIVGKSLVPSQYRFDRGVLCQETIELACKNKNTDDITYEKIQANYNGIQLDGVICYPPNWDKTNKSHCTLLHNSKKVTISQYFNKNCINTNLKEGLPPKSILDHSKTPIILYDYRGTGINKSKNSINSTADSVVKDGVAFLDVAFTKFDEVSIAGYNLGGGVATVSLNNYLQQNENINTDRVKLHSLNSFTNTPRVILPKLPTKIVDFLGWLVGFNINAESAMKNLIKRNVKIEVLHKEHEKLIPKEARMITFMEGVQELKQARFKVT